MNFRCSSSRTEFEIKQAVPLTLQPHPDVQTFLEAAEWTPFSLGFINLTVLTLCTCVPFVILYGPLKETL